MSTQSISRRYARALFELIQEGSDLGSGLSQLAAVASLGEVEAVLSTPDVAAAVKVSILEKASKVESGELNRLLMLLAGKNKLVLLPEINAMVEQMVRDLESEVVASVSSAIELTDANKADIASALSAKSGRKVRLETELDTSLLGGMIVRIGDRQLDYSLRSRLDTMRKTIAG